MFRVFGLDHVDLSSRLFGILKILDRQLDLAEEFRGYWILNFYSEPRILWILDAQSYFCFGILWILHINFLFVAGSCRYLILNSGSHQGYW